MVQPFIHKIYVDVEIPILENILESREVRSVANKLVPFCLFSEIFIEWLKAQSSV